MYIIGIDVSKKKLHCAWLIDPQGTKARTKTVANTPAGFPALLGWVDRHTQAPVDQLHFVLEATGIYHEAVAQALHAAGARVSVVNPLQVKRFAQSRGIGTKTDAHDPKVLAWYGHERQPAAFTPPAPDIKHLKALLARRDALDKDIQRERNRREKAQILNTPKVIDSIDTVLKTLLAERDRLDREIDNHIDRHPRLKQDRALLKSIPGIGDKLSARFVALFRAKTFRRVCGPCGHRTPIRHQRAQATATV